MNRRGELHDYEGARVNLLQVRRDDYACPM
jgi:hypothetical protein